MTRTGAVGVQGMFHPEEIARRLVIREYVERKTSQMSVEQMREQLAHHLTNVLSSFTYPEETLLALVQQEYPDILEKHAYPLSEKVV